MKKLAIYIFIAVSILFSTCSPNGLDKDAFVLDIKTLSFEKETLLFGNEQDIMIAGLPDSALLVTRIDGGFVWKLNKPAYVKFNGNDNPNAIGYDTINQLTVGGKIINREQIDNALLQWFKNTKESERRYVLLADVLQNSPTDLKTLIVFDNGTKKMILLDRNITVNNSHNFKNKGTVSGNSLKIEFFRTFHSEFLSSKNREKYFHKGDTCFTTSVKSFYTPFGANEITLTGIKNTTKVSFNKIYRALIPKETIDATYQRNGRIPVSLRQIKYANTYSNEIYATNIANPNYWEFGTIDSSKNYKFEVDGKSYLQKGEHKAYLLNSGDFWKGLLPLLIVFVLGLIILQFVNYDKIYEGEDNQGESRRWQKYFPVLYSVLFVLGILRIFVGYNLAFTQPFFPVDFPTAVVVAPLILANVLLFWLIYIRKNFGKEVLKMKGLIICGILLAPLIILFLVFRNSDIFTSYWQNFNFEKYFSAALHVNKTVLKDFSPYIHTIYLLNILLVVNVGALLLPKLRNILLYVELIVLPVLFFILGKNSYSAGLFLVTIGVLCLLLERNFLKINTERNWLTHFGQFILCFLLCFLIVFFARSVFSDAGYFINVYAFFVVMVIVISTTYSFYNPQGAGDINANRKKAKKNTFISLGIGLALVFVVSYLGNKYVHNHYDPISSSRLKSRLTTFYDFNQIHEVGYRQSEEQSQFFAELTKYAYPMEFDCYEPIHSGISNFIDPVVENDLSAPFGLIYQFGKAWKWSIVLLLSLWGILAYAVFKMCIVPVPTSNNERRLTKYAVVRLFCLSMLIGSGLWLILSYYGIVPFTGRLIFGLGQDSIAEVFETLFLFVFMGLVGKSKN